jgi:GH24 family phage-related lysozyme (muramidase)
MREKHPFTFNVMADPFEESRYRWTVCEGSQIHMRSPKSYETQSEAEKEAVKALSRREERWRSGE